MTANDPITPHPLRGTCPPDCDHHGVCHCGCGRRTNVATQNHVRRGMSKGQPRVFAHGHYAKAVPPTFGKRPPYYRCGTLARPFLADVELLVRLHGSARKLAGVLGVSEAWVSLVRRGKINRLHLGMAQRIAAMARGTREQVGLEVRRERWAEQARKRRVA